jgi:type II secretory pathway pseudopilin PulG
MRQLGTKLQRGFLTLEVIIALAVVASVTAVVGSQKVIDDAEATMADGVGVYLDNLREAMALYQTTNFEALEDGSPIPGFADPLKPTLDELKAKNMINPAYPSKGPGGWTPLITGSRDNCPSPPGDPTCRIGFVISTPGSLTMPRTGNRPRYDLAVAAVQAARGTGGMTFSTDTNRLRGPSFNVANPITGNPGAVVATATFLDTAFWNQFVRMQDRRDPDLQGNLTVKNNLEIKGTTHLHGDTKVDGNLTVVNVVGAGNNGTCNRAELLPDGRVVARSDCSDANRVALDPNAGSVTVRRGGVDRVRVTTADNGGHLSLTDTAGADSVVLDGTNGRVQSTVLNVDGRQTALVGQPCSQNGDIIRDGSAEGTTLYCRNGTWVMGGRVAAPGAACQYEGSIGTDPTSQAEYICRTDSAGTPPTWKRLNDRVTRSVLLGRYYGKHGDFIAKPNVSECPAPGIPSVLVVPAETATDYALQPPRSRFVATAVASASGWTLSLVLSDGANAYSTSFAGAPYNLSAFVLVHCDYSF